MTADCVDFIDENNAGRFLLGAIKKIAYAGGAHTDKHFNKIEPLKLKKGTFASPAVARANKFFPFQEVHQQNTFRKLSTEPLKLSRILQEFNQFHHFHFRFINTGNFIECDFFFRFGVHFCAVFPKRNHLFTGAAQTPENVSPEQNQKNE